jgi:Protein of unknown function (DUF3237)
MPLADPDTPGIRLVYEAEVDIALRQDLGGAPGGQRFLVPILGGRFDGPMGLRGIVLPGGADRQLLRPDGVKELDALYELQADDGAVITVRNRVLVDESRSPQRYARSVVHLRAPDGPHAWLNRRIFVGGLQSLRPQRMAVRVRTYLLD